jgi:hypothetical protein
MSYDSNGFRVRSSANIFPVEYRLCVQMRFSDGVLSLHVLRVFVELVRLRDLHRTSQIVRKRTTRDRLKSRDEMEKLQTEINKL